MNKKEILNELLQENPEISKEKMTEILEILLGNNPKIEINKDFRKKLKTRLENIGNYEKKTFFQKYFKIFVPAFSAFGIFVIFSFFYSDFLNNSKNLEKNLMQEAEFKEENIGEENLENVEILKASLDLENFEKTGETKNFDKIENEISEKKLMQKREFKIFEKKSENKFEIKNFEKSISLDELEKFFEENKSSKLSRNADNKEIFGIIFKYGEITGGIDFLDSEIEKLTSKELVKNISEKINSMLEAQAEAENGKIDVEIIGIKYINL